MFILSQCLFVLGAAIIVSTYFLKNSKAILALSILACVVYSAALLLIGGYTGAALNIVSIIASVWFFIETKKREKRSLLSLIFIFALTLLTTLVIIIFKFEGIISLVATMALFAFMYSIWQENLLIHKWLGVATAVCWIFYNIYYHSPIPVVLNSLFILVDIVAIIKFHKTKKENK